MNLWKYIFNSNKEEGFTIPLVLGLGLFMLLTGITAIKMSSSSEANSKIQEKTNQAVAAAEVGLIRFQNLLDNNRAIAVYRDCVGERTDADGDGFKETCPDNGDVASWANATKITSSSTGTSACGATTSSPSSTSVASQSVVLGWVDIDSSDSSKGQYRLISYSYSPLATVEEPPGVGELIVEGRTDQFGQSTKAFNTGTARLKAEIAVTENESTFTTTVPGLWMGANNHADLGVNKVRGDILIEDPSCATGGNLTNNGSLDVAKNTYSGDGESYDITISSEPMPATPSLPANLNGITSNDIYGQNLPRINDIKHTDGAYHYLVPSITKATGNDKQIDIASGETIILYVQGDIELNGNTGNASGFEPQDLQIYGNTFVGDNKGYQNSDYKYGGTQPTQQIDLSGTGNVTGFIHAPEAYVCVNGGGKPFPEAPASFTGALWVEQWQTDKAFIPSGYNKLTCTGGVDKVFVDVVSIPPKKLLSLAEQDNTIIEPAVSSTSSWERMEVE